MFTATFRNLWIWAVIGCLAVAVAIFALQLPHQIRHGEKGQQAIQMLDAMRRPFLAIKQAEANLIETGDIKSASPEFARAAESAGTLLARYQQIALYNPELSKNVARLVEAYKEWLAAEQQLFNQFSQSDTGKGVAKRNILEQMNKTSYGFLKTINQLGEGEVPIHQDIDKGRYANRLFLILLAMLFLYLVSLIFLQQRSRTHILQKTHDVLKALARQQAAVAGLGQLALSDIDIPSFSDRVVRIVAEILGVEYSKVLEFLPDKNAFLLCAGVGWKEGLVGNATVDAGKNSQAGYTLLSSEPVIVKDLRKEERFNGPPLLFDHRVVSGVSVIIHGQGRPFGVLGVHTTKQRIFAKDDVNFLQAVANVLADAIERRQIERALQESEENFRALAENANDGILIAVGQGSHVYANRRAAEIVGYTAEEMQRITIEDLAHPDEFPRIIERFKKRLEGISVPSQYETVIVRKDGVSLPVEITGSRTIWRKQPAFLVIMRDITERKRLEAEILKTSKIESLGILAGGIAHDFNNILTAILGNISLGTMSLNPKDELFKRLIEAEKACLRARDLTYQLLTFSTGGMPVKRTASITGVLRESVSFALKGSNVQCEFSISDDLWPVEIDEGQMTQVISNLIINAKQAMPEGGTIKIQGENITGKKEETEYGLLLQEEKYVKIAIEDYGIGIPKEHLHKIFDPYFTTKEKGSGLGLTIAYSIIKNHNGYITVRSEAGVGTNFYIYLPSSEKRIPAETDRKEKPLMGRGRILLMDDEEMIRKVAGELLTHFGYTVEFARNGKEAIELYKGARKSGQAFDAVILDLTIPGGMGGKETIKKLLKIDPEVKAIVSSGYSNDPIMADFRKYGFSGVVTKPYQSEELCNTVYKVVKGLV